MDSLQKFMKHLNREPARESIAPTPDNRAHTVTISHVEMTLDELYFGRWSTTNFTWSAIGNEVQGSLTLKVHHPVTNEVIERTGAASIVITVDKAPEGIKLGVEEFEIREAMDQLGDLVTDQQKQHIFGLLNNRNNE
jgi:hypothetical protein